MLNKIRTRRHHSSISKKVYLLYRTPTASCFGVCKAVTTSKDQKPSASLLTKITSNAESHQTLTRILLQIMNNSGLTIQCNKCQLMMLLPDDLIKRKFSELSAFDMIIFISSSNF